jgi:hypothetical protein
MCTTRATRAIPLQNKTLFSCEIKASGIYGLRLNLVWGSPSKAAPLTMRPCPLVCKTYKAPYSISSAPYIRAIAKTSTVGRLDGRAAFFTECIAPRKFWLKRSQRGKGKTLLGTGPLLSRFEPRRSKRPQRLFVGPVGISAGWRNGG